MRKSFYAFAFLFIMDLLVIIYLFTTAKASGLYDGSWAITIRTSQGTCDSLAYAYVDVVGDHVHVHSMNGNRDASAAGMVKPGGFINVSLGQNDGAVTVRGRLRPSSGSGLWQATGKGCSGSWSSMKRG